MQRVDTLKVYLPTLPPSTANPGPTGDGGQEHLGRSPPLAFIDIIFPRSRRTSAHCAGTSDTTDSRWVVYRRAIVWVRYKLQGGRERGGRRGAVRVARGRPAPPALNGRTRTIGYESPYGPVVLSKAGQLPRRLVGSFIGGWASFQLLSVTRVCMRHESEVETTTVYAGELLRCIRGTTIVETKCTTLQCYRGKKHTAATPCCRLPSQ